MDLKIISVRAPEWADAQKTSINCKVEFDANSELIPCCVSENYDLEHGREIFKRCIAGEYGPIKQYTPAINSMLSSDTSKTSNSKNDWAKTWPEVQEFIIEANAENASGSSRGIGLVWGSMLEEMLGNFIESKLIALRILSLGQEKEGRCQS